ncbi:hypothetical protein A3L11_04105 [Thermococcus siculi]|uniref:SdpI family protein n=1 Tax=Thermococcus siculi TaxID=72803 RepID=A0A2Z2MKX6_9EURY|nr:SdpI family protein [Thermococcus siculi]ASJ08458.1 hypothetical protein A3L11_04105 [Thermococcus siculi]
MVKVDAQTAVELFAGLSLLIAGVMTLAFRNRPNSLIGVRMGYTYMSEEAWRKANTAGGALLLGLSGILLAMTAAGVSMTTCTLVLLGGVLTVVGISSMVARKAYEIEEMSTEAPKSR